MKHRTSNIEHRTLKPAGRGATPACLPAVLAFLLLPGLALSALLPEEQIQFADGLYARGLYEVAEPEYELFAQRFPAHTNAGVALYRLADCQARLGKTSQAAETLEKIMKSHSGSTYRARAGFKLAELQSGLGQHERSAETLKTLLAGKPPAEIEQAALYLLGSSLAELGRDGEAEETLGKLVGSYPASEYSSHARLMLGNICRRAGGRTGEAAEYYRAAAEAPATAGIGAEAWFQLADVLFREKSFSDSAEAYERLLSLYPGDERAAQARLNAGWAMQNAGRNEEALAIVDRAMAESKGAGEPKADEWLYLKANCERNLGRKPAAIETYARILADFPDSPVALAAAYERASVLQSIGRNDEALVQLDKARCAGTALEPDITWLKGVCLVESGRPDEGMARYREVVDRFPDSRLAGDASYRIAGLFQQKGDLKEAAGWYRRTFDAHGGEVIGPRALFALALCLAAQEKHEEADAAWVSFLKLYSGHELMLQAAFRRAVGLSLMRKDDEAMAAFTGFAETYGDSDLVGEASYRLGILLEEAGRQEEAEAALRRALVLDLEPALKIRALVRLAVILHGRERFDEAADMLEKCISEPAGQVIQPSLVEWLAGYRYSQKRFADAVAAGLFLAGQSEQAEWQQAGHTLAGRACAAMGDNARAQESFALALKSELSSAYSAEAALRTGQYALEKKDADAARQCFERSAEDAGADELIGIRARAYAGLAETYRIQGRHEEAARHFMSVAVLFDDPETVPECLYRAAEAYGAIKKPKARREALLELTKRYPESSWTKKAESESAE